MCKASDGDVAGAWPLRPIETPQLLYHNKVSAEQTLSSAQRLDITRQEGEK